MTERMAGRRWFVAVCLVACVSARARAAELALSPREVVLTDAFARRQVLVEFQGRDATRAAKYASNNAAVARVDPTGYVTPRAEGTTEIVVTHEGQQAILLV